MSPEIKQWQERIETEIQSLPLNSSPADLYEPIKYMLSLGGKRMRPLLVLLSCELFGGATQKALKAAAGIELFHNFTLLHDDIMDNAPVRRTKPTVHTKWNHNVAILSGDTLFVKAFQMMMEVEDQYRKPVLDLFTATAVQVCEGQQIDMDFEKSSHIKIFDYLAMIEKKTAVLMAASLKTGALLAGALPSDAEQIYEFGRNIGITFQLQDDILDVYGSSEKFGKQVGGDILSNKKTFLLLKAFELANIDQYNELQRLLRDNGDKFEPWEKIQHVTSIYNTLGVKESAREEMEKFHKEAIRHLDNVRVEKAGKELLLNFCESLLVREY